MSSTSFFKASNEPLSSTHRDAFTAGNYLLFFACIIVIIRLSWVGEDSYIAWRVVDNFIHGEGLRWNLGDRVQVYTNPLWTLIIGCLAFITKEVYFTVLAASYACTIGAMWIMLRRLAASQISMLPALALLLGSKAFMDYSTSGLENCLNYLLMAVFLHRWWNFALTKSNYQTLIFITALALVSRLDMAMLLIVPCLWLFYTMWRSKVARLPWLIGHSILALMPLFAWLAFATLYYGFPLPNTYYAKVAVSFPKTEVLLQGFFYYVASLQLDSLSLPAIALVLVLAFRSRKTHLVVSALSILSYLFYTLWVGGDFMNGRFFSIPVFLAACLLARLPLAPLFGWVLAGGFVVLGLFNVNPNLTYDFRAHYGSGEVPNHGIADERAFWSQFIGLLKGKSRIEIINDNHRSNFQWKSVDKPKVAILGRIGMGIEGYKHGPNYHWIDFYAIGDPFIARLEPMPRPDWRIGHHWRPQILELQNYWETGKIQFSDSAYQAYYPIIKSLTQDPVFDKDRLLTLINYHTGKYKELEHQIKPCRLQLGNFYSETNKMGFEDGRLYLEAQSEDYGKFLIFGPYLYLHPGKHELEIDFETLGADSLGKLHLDVFNINHAFASKIVSISNVKGRTTVKFPFYLNEPLQQSEFRIKYESQATVRIHGFRLYDGQGNKVY